MKISEIKKIIYKNEWYKQGGAIKPLYVSYPFYSCSEMRLWGRKIIPKYNIFAYFNDDFMEDYISCESLKKVAEFYYKKQLKNKDFINKFSIFWHENFVAFYLKEVKFIMQSDLRNYSNEELLILFEKFTRLYLGVWQEVIFLDGFDYYGGFILSNILDDAKKNISPEDLELLLTPPQPSLLQQERLGILNIADQARRKKIPKIKNYKKIISTYPWLDKKLNNHSAQYYWLHNDFASIEYLGPDFFYSSVLQLLSDSKKYKEEQKMKKFLNTLNFKKSLIIKKYKLSPKTVNLLQFLSILGNLRDERKSYNQMAGNVIRKMAEEFSRRTGIKIYLIENFYHWEIKNIFTARRPKLEILKNRMDRNFNYLLAPTETASFVGKQGKQLNDFIKKITTKNSSLEGMPAFKGIVQGKVKIVKDKKDFHKMKKGDILIAPNTRPEFLPVMKIAGAIITEEGGITCHAAIVSRELKIPAVVGVQGIIAVLKDNNLIEVDAEKGVVKILKK